MATLKVESLKCIEETDEVGRDDIYIVLFIGRRSSPKREAEVKAIGPGGPWSNLETGNLRVQDVTLDAKFDPRDFYVIAMVECDAGRDVSAPLLKDQLEPLWQGFGVLGGSDEEVFARLIFPIIGRISSAGDDEIVGLPRLLKQPTSGRPSSMRFQGDGGEYKILFKLE